MLPHLAQKMRIFVSSFFPPKEQESNLSLWISGCLGCSRLVMEELEALLFKSDKHRKKKGVFSMLEYHGVK